MIQYIIDKGVDLECYISIYNNNSVHYNCIDIINERFKNSSNDIEKNKFLMFFYKN